MLRATSYRALFYLMVISVVQTLACSGSGTNPAVMPQFDRCQTTTDCREGDSCQSGVCVSGSGQVSTDAACQAASDCMSGMACESGRCVADIIFCAHDNNCGYQEMCVSGKCKARKKVPDCRKDHDCAIGRCSQGKCR